MLAAISIQVCFSPDFVVHTAALLENETREDMLENARISAMNVARQYELHYGEKVEYTTLVVHFGGNDRVCDNLVTSWEDK